MHAPVKPRAVSIERMRRARERNGFYWTREPYRDGGTLWRLICFFECACPSPPHTMHAAVVMMSALEEALPNGRRSIARRLWKMRSELRLRKDEAA